MMFNTCENKNKIIPFYLDSVTEQAHQVPIESCPLLKGEPQNKSTEPFSSTNQN